MVNLPRCDKVMCVQKEKEKKKDFHVVSLTDPNVISNQRIHGIILVHYHVRSHPYLVNFVSDNHANDLLAGAICVKLIEPGLKIIE